MAVEASRDYSLEMMQLESNQDETTNIKRYTNFCEKRCLMLK
jgi:hypothetical protein